MPEYKTQSLKKSRLILSHYGMFKGCWDWLILVATIYIAIAVPYNASFVKNFERVTMPSDVVVEALFIVGETKQRLMPPCFTRTGIAGVLLRKIYII